MRPARALLVLVTAVCLGGCSVGMKKLPPGWTPASEPECDASAARPLTDAALGAVSLGAASYLFWRYPPGASSDGPCAVCPTVPALVLAAAGFLLALSSLDGYDHVRRCRKAKRSHAEHHQ